jgi:hypothetical protein
MNLVARKGMLVCALLLAAPNLNAQDPVKSQAEQTRQDYVGDESCRGCHADQVQSYLRTAHHLTSRVPSKESVLGSFAPGKNILNTATSALFFQMESKPDGFYETAVSLSSSSYPRSERIDLVIGSGRVGQTYLYWRKDQLFQLPVSYWVDLDSWVNSPGYRDGTANFERPIVPRCLECHLTYADALLFPRIDTIRILWSWEFPAKGATDRDVRILNVRKRRTSPLSIQSS